MICYVCGEKVKVFFVCEGGKYRCIDCDGKENKGGENK
jgi:hypothetical protein